MASFSLEDLITPLTKEQVTESIYNVLGIVGVDTTSWKPGAVTRTIIAACAIILAALSTLTASIARAGFLELSSGQWLTLVAKHVYGVDRIDAAFAEGAVTLTNTSGAIYSLDPDDLVVANPTSGKTYRNTSAFTLNPSTSLTVAIRATEAGSDSSSNPGTITELETVLNGVTCTNALAVVGNDEESDPALKVRCREKLGSLSPNGPWDAYSFAARNATTVAGVNVGVTRVLPVADGLGGIAIYVATASGGVSGDANDPNTDLGAVNEAIHTLATPLAVTSDAVSATPVVVPVTYSVWMYNTSGLDEAEIETAIASSLSALMSAQPIGGNKIPPAAGKVFVDAISKAIASAVDEIFHVEVTAPAADVELTNAQVAVLGTVTATAITQLPPSEGG